MKVPTEPLNLPKTCMFLLLVGPCAPAFGLCPTHHSIHPEQKRYRAKKLTKKTRNIQESLVCCLAPISSAPISCSICSPTAPLCLKIKCSAGIGFCSQSRACGGSHRNIKRPTLATTTPSKGGLETSPFPQSPLPHHDGRHQSSPPKTQ